MPNKTGEAVPAKAYQAAIVTIIQRAGGVISERDLDRKLREAYADVWGPTDNRPWGNGEKAKWRQNVASAKSGLDRRCVVIRFRRVVGKFRPIYRVLLGSNAPSIVEAVRQRDDRRPQRKRPYKRLRQPRPVYVVPV